MDIKQRASRGEGTALANSEQIPDVVSAMRKPKGSKFVSPEGAGRAGIAKGMKARNTIELKDMVLDTLKELGGKRYLKRQATANAPAFLAMVAKLLPKDLHVSGLEHLTVNLMGPPAARPEPIDVTPSAVLPDEGASGALAPPRSE
jgi:hypothetical protein